MVAYDRLRFDFSHGGAIGKEKLDEIELYVNKAILSNAEVKTRLMKYDEAVNTGAMALFGEKYEEEVRVVSVENDQESHSVELCGGTHVSRLGEIGGIKIISESAIAAGIRRIEAVTGINAYRSWRSDYNLITDIAGLLQSKSDEILEKITGSLHKNRELEKALKSQKQSSLANNISEKEIQAINDIGFLAKIIEETSMADVRALVQQYLSNKNNGVILLFGRLGDKISFVCGVTKDLHSKIGAQYLMKVVADIFDSSGGGNDFIAQGGGKMDVDKVERSINDIINILKSI